MPRLGAASTFYLYDGGVLLATFDANDNVIDMFVNGPQGRIASYYQNNSAHLYYYLTDQLGSSRVMMRGSMPNSTYPHQVVEYYNYQPFGQAIESWGSYATPFKFTGKERDVHSTFAFDYFGARYYDPRIGQFTSVDAAAQFSSGYVYGGNNPISIVDPDGNFGFFAFLAYAAMGYSSFNAVVALSEGDYLGAAFSVAGLVGLPTGIPNFYKGTNLIYSAASGGLTSAANRMLMNGITGQKALKGVGSAFGMGAASGFVAGGQRGENARAQQKQARIEKLYAGKQKGSMFSMANRPASAS